MWWHYLYNDISYFISIHLSISILPDNFFCCNSFLISLGKGLSTMKIILLSIVDDDDDDDGDGFLFSNNNIYDWWWMNWWMDRWIGWIDGWWNNWSCWWSTIFLQLTYGRRTVRCVLTVTWMKNFKNDELKLQLIFFIFWYTIINVYAINSMWWWWCKDYIFYR